ncbi:amylo-alpha-1,6-glucosidase [Tengunoibacter tsumagoiensis]|uniref:Amylo-alpha-1,6-glucosidase n=1 Tax=Tengunoibacter tsumagoiensis TaxID=2014871 RepID=A0A401ZW46_9CHLR|nr:glycogen debranching N-terminal domain-containing protein [Tengunoibacter tsumagoiensis]GCE11131.1 amylo-alpha-1,6-glucosidase [Tengunoibacter tsumagoiensis]
MTDQIEMKLLPALEQEEIINSFALIEGREQVSTSTLTLKCGDTFLLADACGDLLAARQEMGLFRHGTRFLRTCNLFLEGLPLTMLSHQVADIGDSAHIDLTNTAFTSSGGELVEAGVVHVNRYIELEQDYQTQTFTVTNFATEPLQLRLSLKIGADFCDLFEVRGMQRPLRGTLQAPKVQRDRIVLSYCGLDTVERSTHIAFEPATSLVSAERIDWVLSLPRSEPVTIRLTINTHDGNAETILTTPATTLWREQQLPTISTNDPLFNQLLQRGMNDLMMLSTMTPHGFYPFAGIPWFSCPFGRDGLLTALEFLPWFPQVAQGTLAFLAAYQGTKVEPFTDEEPGRILHEFRTGEMANLREIPYIPYYGTVDATPLFLIVLEAYIRWTNDFAFLDKIWPNAEAAAQWIVEYGDRDGDGFIEYHTASEKGLSNQGWKDAWDAIVHGDGRVARAPKALCEVQGYVYAAYQSMATLARKLGKMQAVQQWEERAEALQERFLQTFWWEDEHVFYQALAENKELCDVVSSNAGQCLWTGIVPNEKARLLIKRLMQEDMFSGWGIRTLSTREKRYNPMSYHNGSIWPHDTALIGAGFALQGGKDEAGKVLKSLYAASQYYEDSRLPELYCGFVRRPGYGPTRYPVSCSPQAWAAGAPFILISALLGLHPNAEAHRLTLHQPTLPEWLHTLEINGLFVGGRRVHLRFIRMGEHTEVVLGKENEVDIRVL